MVARVGRPGPGRPLGTDYRTAHDLSRAAHSPTVGRLSRPLTGWGRCGSRPAGPAIRRGTRAAPGRNHQGTETGARAPRPAPPGQHRTTPAHPPPGARAAPRPHRGAVHFTLAAGGTIPGRPTSPAAGRGTGPSARPTRPQGTTPRAGVRGTRGPSWRADRRGPGAIAKARREGRKGDRRGARHQTRGGGGQRGHRAPQPRRAPGGPGGGPG